MKTRTWGNWAKEKLSSITQRAKSIYQSVTTSATNITGTIGKVLSYDYVKKFLLQYWEGLTQTADPHHLTQIAESPKSRKVLAESVKVNLVYYLGVILLFEYFNSKLKATSFGKSDKALNYSTIFAIDALLSLGYTIIWAHRIVDNAELNIALIKNMTDENPIDPGIFPPCEHSEASLVKAGVLSPIYAKTLKLKILGLSQLPIIKYLTPIANSYVDGSVIAEILYGGAGNCTEDRAKLLAKNLGFSLGIGTAAQLTERTIANTLSYFLGVRGFFISEAISSMIYPFFVAAVLLRDRPLQSNLHGIDLSYFHRYSTNHMLEVASEKIIPLLKSDEKSIDWLGHAEHIANFPPVRMGVNLFTYDVYGNWKSPNGFIVGIPSKLVMEAYFNLILTHIQKYIDLHEKPLTKMGMQELSKAVFGPIVAKLPDDLTAFFGLPDSYKQILNMFFTAHTKEMLSIGKKIILFIHQKQQESMIKIVHPSLQDIKSYKELPPVPPIQKPANDVVVENSNVKLFKRNQSLIKIENMYQFLIDLKSKVNDKKWNDKGSSLFSFSVPKTIGELRKILKPIHDNISQKDINLIFETISKLESIKEIYQFIPNDFKIKKALIIEKHKPNNRSKEVEELYIDIAVKIKKIQQNMEDTKPRYRSK